MKPIRTTIAAAAAFAMQACARLSEPTTDVEIFETCAQEALNNTGAKTPDIIDGMLASSTSIGEDANGNPHVRLNDTTLTLTGNGAEIKAEGPHAAEAAARYKACAGHQKLAI